MGPLLWYQGGTTRKRRLQGPHFTLHRVRPHAAALVLQTFRRAASSGMDPCSPICMAPGGPWKHNTVLNAGCAAGCVWAACSMPHGALSGAMMTAAV
jgi:hypothetical protein